MAGTARDFAQIGCCGAKSVARRKFFGARKRASEPCRRAAAAAVDVAPVFARTAMRCETRSCFQGFFRERIRARGANADIDDRNAHASTAVPPRLPRDRPGTFVLQKC
jgi:hypothetical protein